jgi:hypothetical protein
MHGLLQTSFFFGYNAVVCFAFFLMLGSVGWRASLLFVRSIYRVSKLMRRIRCFTCGANADAIACMCNVWWRALGICAHSVTDCTDWQSIPFCVVVVLLPAGHQV